MLLLYGTSSPAVTKPDVLQVGVEVLPRGQFEAVTQGEGCGGGEQGALASTGGQDGVHKVDR